MVLRNGMRREAWRGSWRLIAGLALWCWISGAARAEDAELDRGKYLVTFGGCTDCHTPGHLLGHPDLSRFLGGSDTGFAIPGLGVFVGRNLTPEKETGLGSWTREQIATAITSGRRPDGRILAPVMPWRAYAQLTRADALAIAAYLQSLPPVKQHVPEPYGPSEKVAVFVMDVLPAGAHNDLQASSNGQGAPAK
jgi:mono/diheme cytochrome c family protein